VDPLLLVGDEVPFQPHIAEPTALELRLSVGDTGQPKLTSPGALLQELASLLGELLVAGADRIYRHDDGWREFIRQAQRAGSRLIADHVEAFLTDQDPGRIEQLLLVLALGQPLV
jgi:hypothetical protein